LSQLEVCLGGRLGKHHRYLPINGDERRRKSVIELCIEAEATMTHGLFVGIAIGLTDLEEKFTDQLVHLIDNGELAFCISLPSPKIVLERLTEEQRNDRADEARK
jgi:hypothetical protein